jgi:hypothetical protein
MSVSFESKGVDGPTADGQEHNREHEAGEKQSPLHRRSPPSVSCAGASRLRVAVLRTDVEWAIASFLPRRSQPDGCAEEATLASRGVVVDAAVSR